jgi:hypothetical protein
LRPVCLPNERLNAALESIAKINVNAGGSVGLFHDDTL